MATDNGSATPQVGDWVRILNSGYTKPGKIVEFRGALGPAGARVYRVKMRSRPNPAFIEVREDQLEVVTKESRFDVNSTPSGT